MHLSVSYFFHFHLLSLLECLKLKWTHEDCRIQLLALCTTCMQIFVALLTIVNVYNSFLGAKTDAVIFFAFIV